ncbi:MAG: DUF488 domain-containing protein [Bacteroidales bacterium]|jgi:uncharacterized protein (DUF488 family)|nr:DUF488 domain-containing protein [Bacteroidales bacterium]
MVGYRLYSIGHSSQTQEEFLALLIQYRINCIVDVRSVPASKYTPQFNEEALKWFLKSQGIQYLHFGDEFGARRTDCIDKDGQVNFEQAVKTSLFQQGVARLMKGLGKGYRIALMCSESDPLECHRFSMVSRYFYDQGVDVQHILRDGNLASHAFLEKEMINQLLHSRKYHLPEVDLLFGTYSEEEQRKDAYRLKNKEIGYKPELQLEEAY